MAKALNESKINTSMTHIPTLEEIKVAHEQLKPYVLETPVWEWKSEKKRELLGDETEVFIKLELLQYGSSFKARGALSVMLSLDEEAKKRGVTAVSAGNHAIAVSLVAKQIGTHSKVVMPPTASPASIARCRKLGAEVIIVDHVSQAFDKVAEIQETEGRTFVHPFEGPMTTLGTATLGYEYYHQVEHLDVALLPIGGGGLSSGMALAINALNPDCQLIGVEAEGAPNMYESFKLGAPAKNESVNTIAASLSPPYSLPYSYEICQKYLDKVVLVNDEQLCQSMSIIFSDLKLAVEPAGASTMAALLGPLREELTGKRVGIIACGSNIDIDAFTKYVKRGEGGIRG